MTVKWDGPAVIVAVRRGAMRGVVRGTESVRTEADSLMNETPRTGRSYTRRGVTHIASSPGNAPAPDTGRLRQSLQTLYDTSALVGTVNAATAYAAALEFGTSRIEPRPFMRPALASQVRNIESDIAAEIRRALA